jgi:hypothetical protein
LWTCFCCLFMVSLLFGASLHLKLPITSIWGNNLRPRAIPFSREDFYFARGLDSLDIQNHLNSIDFSLIFLLENNQSSQGSLPCFSVLQPLSP